MEAKKITLLKKSITNDWNKLFPYMGVYKNMWLMNICGPLAVGILLEVKSDRKSYIPTLHIHNLCQEFPVVSLGISMEIKEIEINDVNKTYLYAANELKKNTFIALSGDVVLNELLEQLKVYFYKFKLNPIIVLEYMVYLAVWSGCHNIYNEVMGFVVDNIKKHSDMFRDDDVYREWYQMLPKDINCVNKLRAVVKEQELKLKTLKLPHRNVIFD